MADSTPPKKKKKRKSKISIEDEEETVLVLISVNGDDTFFPYDYVPEQSDWCGFSTKVKSITNTSEFNCSMKYEKIVAGKTYGIHLNEQSFCSFDNYAKKSISKETPINIYLTYTQASVGSSLMSANNNKNQVTNDTTKKNQKKDQQEHTNKEKISTERLITGFEEKDWDSEYVQSFDKTQRENVFRELVNRFIIKDKCNRCPQAHTLRYCKSSPPLYKLKALITPTEKRYMFSKRDELLNLLGNGDLLINPMYIQCPICATIISIGHFNKIAFRNDHLIEHLKSSHFNDTVRHSNKERALAYLCIQRYKNYYENNKKMLIPKLKCCPDGIHHFLPYEVPETRTSPFNKNPICMYPPSVGKLICKSHKEELEDNEFVEFDIDLKERCLSQREYCFFASDTFPHFEIHVNNMQLLFLPNAEIIVSDAKEAAEDGLLGSDSNEIHET